MGSPAEERSETLADLGTAAGMLVVSMNNRLVPKKGGNIGYALKGAREGEGVAAITGGFAADGRSVRCNGPAAFGADPEISRIILTAMKFDPSIRSAGVIRYSEKAFRILSDMCVDSATADPARFPCGTVSMDWAVASCCAEGVPGVIAIHGDDPETGFICVFGENPHEVASNIIILSHRIQ